MGLGMEDSVLIIAEAGVNHDGKLQTALDLVDAAAAAGANVVKFQHFEASSLVSEHAPAAAYQARNTGTLKQRDLLVPLELTRGDFEKIARHCNAKNIEFLCTVFDYSDTDFMLNLGMRRVKIPSGEISNIPALRFWGGLGVPILLSTGMSNFAEVELAVNTLTSSGAKDVTVLQCVSIYPAPVESYNLRAMVSVGKALKLPFGISDHTLGSHLAVAAVGLGAHVVEKHFTLSRSLNGPDHAASIEPSELKLMVRHIRDTSAALGDGIKKPWGEEVETAALVRKSWHSAMDLPAGIELEGRHIVLMRPMIGLAPEFSPIGRRTRTAISAGEAITDDSLEP